ncbi:pentapeptide repeat-containing protein [Amycolatopsis antarctica]|uniref:pentapeptide repeat-containing protein n=1 Tax=Amycolatopsis antarctica TaxID=1854586 RepID=UPI000D7D1151|nr:pentapeptide repeat-containing protein [Amycolatopsis antarctica]
MRARSGRRGFSEGADFRAGEFTESGDFRGTDFGGRTTFRGSRFAGGADFRKARFGRLADFRRVTAGEGVTLTRSHFGGEVNFGVHTIADLAEATVSRSPGSTRKWPLGWTEPDSGGDGSVTLQRAGESASGPEMVTSGERLRHSAERGNQFP